MLTLYFSGTGNTKYIAEKFSARMGYRCHSIEDQVDFDALIRSHPRICVCYPIYGSRMPRIFKEFILAREELFKGKEVIILVTQWLGSGDGARAFIDCFPKGHFRVIYAEHINMPNNISNVFFVPVKNGLENRRKIKRANQRLKQVCQNIQRGKVFRRGFGPVSRILGLCQGIFEEAVSAFGKKRVWVDECCNGCGLCAKLCPTSNLHLIDGKAKQNNNCTICYRCINVCPQKAIAIYVHVKPKKQYFGVR